MDTNNELHNNYSSYYQQAQQPTRPPKKKGGTFKKILVGCIVGLCFGVFAAAGFKTLNLAADKVKELLPKTRITGSINGVTFGDEDVFNNRDDKEPQKPNEDMNRPEEKKVDEPEDHETEAPKLLHNTETSDSPLTTVTDVTEVVKNVMPSVVAVNNKFVSSMSYFGQVYSQEAESAGSGIIVGQSDSELLVVTNYHVVADANELTVTFVDEKQAPAQIKGTDEDKDLAVIAVQLGDVPTSTMREIAVATLGDSDNLTVGEPVVAIGNSLGYGQSVTTGVVSALNRVIAARSPYGTNGADTEDKELPTFIQTDAAINPGNSGGALLNIKGEVIGINSNKIGGEAIEGMGYAIPISDAEPIIEDLMSKQTKLKVAESSRGLLGITGVNVEKEYSEIYGMPIGVYVSSVTEGSGADDAGLVRGDIIVGINGEEIHSMDELKNELSYYAVGTTVRLTIMQGSPTGYQSKEVDVTLSAAAQ